MMRIAARSLFLLSLAMAIPTLALAQSDPLQSPADVPTLQTDPLPDGALYRFGTTRLRLPYPAGYLIFNPDDSVLMVGCGGEVRFWETKSWREIWRLEAYAFSCSPDGKHVARLTTERTVEIWNVDKKTRAHSVSLNRFGRNVRAFDIEFNHNGDGLWLGVSGQGLWLYNWSKGDIVTRINANDIFDGSLCLSRDRKTVAIRRQTEKVSIYDATTGALTRDIMLPRGPEDLAISHDGKVIAAHNQSGQTRFWDTVTGKNVTLLPELPKKPNPNGEKDDDIPEESLLFGQLLFDAKGERIAFVGRLATVDRKEKKLVAQEPADAPIGVTGAIGNTNEYLAVGYRDGSVDIRRLQSLKPVVADSFPRGAALSVAFSHDGKSLATYHDSAAGEVRTWQLKDFSVGKRFIVGQDRGEDETRPVGRGGFAGRFGADWYTRGILDSFRLAFLPGDQRLSFGNGFVWNVTSGMRVKTVREEDRLVRASTDARRWLLAKENSIEDITELTLFDPKAKKTVTKLPLEISADNCYPSRNLHGALSADGDIVALQARPASQRDPNTGEMAFREASIVVWNARGEQPKKIFSTTFEQTPKSFDLSADGRFLVLQGAPSAAIPHRMWHLPSGLPLWKFEKDDQPRPKKKSSLPRIMSDGDLIGEIDFEFEESHAGFMVAFSPDGQFFAESGSGEIVVRETLSGARLLTFLIGDGDICDLNFSPDGRLLASASRDSTVTLWKVPPFAAARKSEWKGENAERLWNQLRGDGLTAFQAMAELHAGGDEAVAALVERVRRETTDEQQQIRDALANLGSPKFLIREKATVRLEQWGYRLKPYLLEAITDAGDLEQKRRLGTLLDRYKSGGIDLGELRLGRCVYLLEQIGTPAAGQLLEEIARGNARDMTVESARAAHARFERKRSTP